MAGCRDDDSAVVSGGYQFAARMAAFAPRHGQRKICAANPSHYAAVGLLAQYFACRWLRPDRRGYGICDD